MTGHYGPIETMVSRRCLWAGACTIPAGEGCIRALYVENGDAALFLVLEGLTLPDPAGLKQAVADAAGLPLASVWIMCQPAPMPQPADQAQMLRAAVQAVQGKQKAYMATGQMKHTAFAAQDEPHEQTLMLLSFRSMDGTPFALLGSGCMPQDAKLHEVLTCAEALLSGQTLVWLTPAGQGVCSPAGAQELAQLIAQCAHDALNPVCTPDVTVPADGGAALVYIGRTMLFGFRQGLSGQGLLHIRSAFPNDRVLMGRLAESAALEEDQLCAETIARMTACRDEVWNLPQAYMDAVATKHLNVAYDDRSPLQQLDIWLPGEPAGKPWPVVVYFHGGAFAYGWQRGNDVIPMLCALDRGYAVVSCQYRLSGEARFPALVYDAKAALRFLRANAAAYNLDMDRFVLWGASAGAWLVSYTALTCGNPALEELHEGETQLAGKPRGVISWCGHSRSTPPDAKRMTPEQKKMDELSPFSRLLGAPTSHVPELCRLASPATHITPDAPPFLLVHGTGDALVPVAQSYELHDRLTRAGVPVEMMIEPGRPHHGDSWMHEPRVIDRCLDFIDRYCKE